MLLKIAAFELKLNQHMFPKLPFFVYTPLSLTIGISSSQRFDEEAEFAAYHAEHVDDALFIDRRMAQSAKIYRFAVLHFFAGDRWVGSTTEKRG